VKKGWEPLIYGNVIPSSDGYFSTRTVQYMGNMGVEYERVLYCLRSLQLTLAAVCARESPPSLVCDQ
jgi:hypothetical protein